MTALWTREAMYTSASHHTGRPWRNPLSFTTTPIHINIWGGPKAGTYTMWTYSAIDQYGVTYALTEATRGGPQGWFLAAYLPFRKDTPWEDGQLTLKHLGYRSSLHEQQRMLRQLAEYVYDYVTDKGELPTKLTKEMIY